MKEKYLITCFGVCAFILLNAIIFKAVYREINLSEDSFRIHITANSDSKNDQIVKLKVQASLEDMVKNVVSSCSDKSEIYSRLSEDLVSILDETNGILKANSMPYLASVKLGKIHYGEKENKFNYSPAGSFDSINIYLGDGKGANFWSIISPYENSGEDIINSGVLDFNVLTASHDSSIKYESFIINTLNKVLAH
ncbi:MAG: stage II sporulation protein R [Clostridia bacterium]